MSELALSDIREEAARPPGSERDSQPAKSAASNSPAQLELRVNSITYQGESINAYELMDKAGGLLPAFSAGSHIDVILRDGRIRQYSLCGDPDDRSRYVFAVQREENGRGGSRAIFEQVRVGDILRISAPRNNFPLHEEAASHLLLAGGIGITPMMAMIRRLQRVGGNFKLYYCTRTMERTAFRRELAQIEAGKVVIHHDNGDPSQGLDLQAVLRSQPAGTHVYCCGPGGFIKAVQAGAEHWPRETVHYERFTTNGVAPSAVKGDVAGDGSFQVELKKSNRTFDIPADKSIVEVLRENGIDVPTSCEAGLCGTCRTSYVGGIPDHRDFILSEEERRSVVLVCCSRAQTDKLVLDL